MLPRTLFTLNEICNHDDCFFLNARKQYPVAEQVNYSSGSNASRRPACVAPAASRDIEQIASPAPHPPWAGSETRAQSERTAQQRAPWSPGNFASPARPLQPATLTLPYLCTRLRIARAATKSCSAIGAKTEGRNHAELWDFQMQTSAACLFGSDAWKRRRDDGGGLDLASEAGKSAGMREGGSGWESK